MRFVLIICCLSVFNVHAQQCRGLDSASYNLSLRSYKSETNNEYNIVESILNRVYFGTAQDMVIYRNALMQSSNVMGLGMFRASIPLEQNLHLLMFKEYIYKVGMIEQTFQFTPYIGIRKRF